MPDQFECINLSYLNSIAEGDESIIKELIDIFLEQIPEFTEGLDQSLSEKRWLDMAAIAHKAKSSVISLGMEELGNRDLKNLELIAKEMQVRSIEEDSNADEAKKQEAEKLTKNLNGYDKERQTWIKNNATPDTAASIIEKFKSVCHQAEEELKLVIKK